MMLMPHQHHLMQSSLSLFVGREGAHEFEHATAQDCAGSWRRAQGHNWFLRTWPLAGGAEPEAGTNLEIDHVGAGWGWW